MRVCFVSSTRYHWTLDTTSEKKFNALILLGELFVIAFSQDFSVRRFTKHAHFYLLPKLPLPALRYAEIIALVPLLSMWLIMRYRVHVLIAQSPYEGFAAAWAKKMAGWLGYRVCLIVESHGDFEASQLLQRNVVLPRLYHICIRYVVYFALKHADVLRAVSQFTKAQLERWSPGKSVFQFPAWTDINVFLQAGVNSKTYSYQDVLYVGMLIRLKGVHHLITAFASLAKDFPRARLVILGREEDAIYAADLKDQVRWHNLGERVRFVTEMAQDDLAKWMRRACILVLPSISEGLGRVVLEAMAAGTPVIGSNVGGVPEIVNEGVTGFLVPPGNEDMLEDRLRWTLEHPEEVCKMGYRAHTFAKSFFSIEAYVNGYKQIFVYLGL